MKEFFPALHAAALFSGISDDELATMLSCLGARIDTFPKGSRLLRAGEAVEEVGLVLAGSALIMHQHFTQAFRQHYGITANKYRRQLQDPMD